MKSDNLPEMPHGCGRCEKDLTENDTGFCWFCNGDLCKICRDNLGHCGHERADFYNQRNKK